MDHAADLQRDVLHVPRRPGAVLADQQHPVDCPAVGHQHTHGCATAVQPAQLLEENADTNSEIDTKLHFSSYIRDSIQFIKIVICLEDEYDLEFDNQDLQLEKYKSIDDFIQMVYQKIVQLSGEGDGS